MHDILHISDVHFGPPHLPDVAAGCLDLIHSRRPDLVVISGDLTQRAKPYQFQQAREFVRRMPVPTLTVPGNHDVPLYRFWERFLDPYGAYSRHFDADLEPVLEREGLLVVGINTAYGRTFKDGRINRRRLAEVERILEAAGEGLFKIVVAHHQLIPPPVFGPQTVLAGARRALEVFSRTGVDLVLSGHYHMAYVGTSEEFYPTGAAPVVVLHSGTTTSNRGRGCERLRNTCNWVRVGDASMTISRLEWDAARRRFKTLVRTTFPRCDRLPYDLGSEAPRND